MTTTKTMSLNKISTLYQNNQSVVCLLQNLFGLSTHDPILFYALCNDFVQPINFFVILTYRVRQNCDCIFFPLYEYALVYVCVYVLMFCSWFMLYTVSASFIYIGNGTQWQRNIQSNPAYLEQTFLN